MAKIKLSEGTFKLIPEGETVFKIVSVNYKEDFGKLEVTLQTQDGLKHTERYNLLGTDGSPCQGAINAFSYMAKCALQDMSLTEIDHNDIVGHFYACDVEHETVPSNKDPNKNVTFIKCNNIREADGWEEETAIPAKSPAVKVKTEDGKPSIDLKALLGS